MFSEKKFRDIVKNITRFLPYYIRNQDKIIEFKIIF